ncbi:MAG: hypothetical protein AAF443_06840 [Chlamydiota bacterium]
MSNDTTQLGFKTQDTPEIIRHTLALNRLFGQNNHPKFTIFLQIELTWVDNPHYCPWIIIKFSMSPKRLLKKK